MEGTACRGLSSASRRWRGKQRFCWLVVFVGQLPEALLQSLSQRIAQMERMR
jgi:hypothetical protein